VSFFVPGPIGAAESHTWNAKVEYFGAEDGPANHEMMLLPANDSINFIIRRFPSLGIDDSHVTF
jgi:hypothetical protein